MPERLSARRCDANDELTFPRSRFIRMSVGGLETQWEKHKGSNHNGRMWVQECVRECEGGVKWTNIQ